jgi:hypothetical protein
VQRIETIGGIAVLALLCWWYFRTADPAVPAVVHHPRSFHGATAKTATTHARTQPDPTQDAEQQRRKALQQETLKAIARKDADYDRAVTAYDTQRKTLADRIQALSSSNKNGCNNSQIEQLEQQRQALNLPQRN